MLFRLYLILLLIISLSTPLIAKTETLKIGVYHNPPSIFIDKNDEPQGLFADLLNAIAQRENWDLDYVQGDWETLFQQLKQAEIDLLTSISYSQERDAFFDFATEPVSVKWGTVYVRPGAEIKILPDLDNKKVAIQKGGIHGQNFRQVSANFGIKPDILVVPSLKIVLELVEQGAVDAGVVNSTFGYLEEEKYQVERSAIAFSPTRATFAAPEGKHGDILRRIDGYLAEWRSDQSSIYYQTYNRWYGGKEYVKQVIPRWLFLVLAVVVGGVLLFALWTKTLRHQVNVQTRELQESNVRFRQLAEHIREVFWISTPDKQEIIYVSPAYQSIWRCSCQSLYDDAYSFLETVHSDDRERVIAAFPKQLQGNYDETYRLQYADGSQCWIRDRAFPVRDENGKVYRLVGIAEDITERVEAEAQIEIANRTKSAFLANMSHELRTPLNAVLGFAQLLSSDPYLELEHKAQIKRIEKSGKQLLSLLSDILEFARMETDTYPTNEPKEAIVLDQFLRNSVDIFSFQAEQKNLSLTIDLDDSLPYSVMSDPKRLRQILLNLLGNALKFTQQGEVSLHASFREGNLQLYIRDTGPGIPLEQQKQLFKPFSTLNQEMYLPNASGIGLGLAITRKIIDMMAGHIELDSHADKGSCFHVSLPMQVASASSYNDANTSLPAYTPNVANVQLSVSKQQDLQAMLARGAISDVITYLKLLTQAPDCHESIHELLALAQAFDLPKVKQRLGMLE